MRLDISKIDERIAKLQELRRIATDAEMAQLLSEFLSTESNASSTSNGTAPKVMAASAGAPEMPRGDGVSELVKGVLDGKDSLAHSGAPSWTAKR